MVVLSLIRRIYIKSNNINIVLFVFLNVRLMFFLFLSFSLVNFFYFYLMFECSLIPILFLILGWGYQTERVQAGVYIIFYTLFASLPLFFLFF